MRKIRRRMLAVLLSVLLLVGSAPVGILAQTQWPELQEGVISSRLNNGLNTIKTAAERTGDLLQFLTVRSKAADPTYTSGNYTYTLSYDDATITNTSADLSGNIVIPATLDDHPVVAIGNQAFLRRAGITAVTIPGSVTSIGKEAFNGCSSLRNVSFPSSLVTIDSNAFSNTALTKVTIPDSVTTIGAGAFLACQSLSEVHLSKNLQKLCGYAFGDCDRLTSIEIPASLKETTNEYYPKYKYGYHPGVFIASDNLKTITFEEGTTKIANGLFGNISTLVSMDLPNTVTEIGNEAFAYCSALSSITLSSSLVTIGANAFAGTALTKVDIPDTVTMIGAGAFLRCQSLSEVRLSKGLQKLCGYAFADCDQLTSIEIPKSLKETTNEYYYDYLYGYHPGVFIASDNLKTVTFEEGTTKVVNSIFGNNSSIESMVLPDTITEIGSEAFKNCKKLKSISLSSSLTTIGANAFSGSALTKVIIPDSVTMIGAGAFLGCQSLAEVRLSKNLQKLCGYAFADCDQLTSIEIPKSLKETTNEYYYDYLYGYHPGVFIASDNLKTVTFEEGTTKVVNSIFGNNSSIESMVLPDTITEIGNEAFKNCSGLKHIVLSNRLEQIGNNVFLGCASLENIVIPPSVKSIGFCGFENCSSLQSAVFMNDDTTIDNHAFPGCSSLERVVLPKNMSFIPNTFFKNCVSLTEFNMPQAITKIEQDAFNNCDSLTDITIPPTVTQINKYAFYDCDGLKTVTMGDAVTSIGTNTFQSCEVLESVVLSRNLTNIPQSCFADCPTLKEIEIPHNIFGGVTTINKEAFKNCTGLKKVVIPVTVTSIGAEAFSYSLQTVIYGCKGSYAETYANDSGFAFVDITKHITGIALKDNDAETVVVARGYNIVPEFDYLPADTTDILTLKSNNTSIVTIKNINQIYGNANGTATVTAMTSGGLDYTFNVLVHTLNSITLKQLPAKLTYNYGEALNLAGMVVTAAYSDGTSETVTDYTVSGYNPETYGAQTVKVTYLNKSATFSVEVIDTRVKLTGIAVTKLPDKTAYEKGETFDPTGIIVTGTYSDGSTAPITGYAISAMNALKTGKQTLTVTYSDPVSGQTFTAQFDVTVGVSAPTLTSIAVRTMPTKTVYAVGESFDQSGLTLTATFSDGSTQTITNGFTCTGFNAATAGTKTITVTYNGKTTTFTVTVNPPHEHVYTSTVTKEPTCKEEGVRTYTCACGDSYTEAIPKTPHTEQVIRAEPTCTAAGMTYIVCAYCGETLSSVTMLPKIAHRFGEWVIVAEPTTEADGLKERTCIYGCGTKETEVVPKIKVMTIRDDASGISLTYPETAFDSDVELQVKQIFDGAAFNLVSLNSEQNVVFDILTLDKNGTQVQPRSKVTVRIPVPAGFNPAVCIIYYVSVETGKVEKLPARYESGYMVFETDHFSYYAVAIAKALPPAITIRNYTAEKTVDYRTTITFTADVQNAGDGGSVHWYMNGKDSGTGETFTMHEVKASFNIQARYVKDGATLAESETETIHVKTGFFARLKAFFRALFGSLPKQVQEAYDFALLLSLLP